MRYEAQVAYQAFDKKALRLKEKKKEFICFFLIMTMI